ncbi:MAG: hypothetical protein OXU36_21345 [Candidatus Poribacteria bacterium]|nr:hypothetical protein [Candidatus Poribacteria bacterium]
MLLMCAEPCLAVRQGAATADLFIKCYTQSGDFAKLALWHEAAAECLKRISVPMNQIVYDYYVQHGYKTWAARAKKEAQEIQEQYQSHRARAKIAWQQFVRGVCNPRRMPHAHLALILLSVLDTESENIDKFITTWLPHYPDRFYEFGIYPTFFRKQRELAEQRGDYVKVLHLEADAATMCAAQYERIPIAYGLRNYEKHRDAYRQYAAHLRKLAQGKPNTLPSEINEGRHISNSLAAHSLPSQQEADTVLQIAESDARVKAALTDQRAVHAYPTFQGFAWIVNFSNHNRGSLATAIIDDKTTTVLGVFSPVK